MRKHVFRPVASAGALIIALWCPAALAQSRPPAAAIPPPLADLDGSIEALVRTVDPSVVQIFTTGLAPSQGVVGTQSELVTPVRASGSGVVVETTGYVVTNAHVVRGASRISVEVPVAPAGQSLLARRSRVVPARLVGLDEETDIAVLKIEVGGLRALPFGDSDALKSGQMVLAFGSPMGLQNSVSLGIVSAVARQLEPESPMVYVQTDASINPGNSGGPLVDAKGRLVGVNTLMVSPSGANSGLGFAAPSNIVRAVFDQIRQSGRVRRGEIGVRAQTVTPLLAAGLGLTRDWGAVLADVTPGSPADRAGLSIGDLVLEVDGKPIENGRQLHVTLYRRAVGDVVKLAVLRDGQQKTALVSVAERPDALSTITAMADPRENVVARLGILGVTLEPEVAALLPMLRGKSGVVVVSATAGAFDSDTGGLQPGDVIHAVNGRWIVNLAALRAAVDGVKAGDPVVLQVERRGVLTYIAFAVD
ncbi:MAG TPA: trypsin-like peptidase domain-containing protein [Vicinamibacterales bacterium]|nr:trypsin-like peptidase domain-containing protein [Vicinamibacterales bacterium]